MGKEEDEIQDSDSQIKCYINDLKTSTCALKETLLSCCHRVKTAENQIQNLVLRPAELQYKLNSQCEHEGDDGKEWDAERGMRMCGKTLMKLGTQSP